MSGLPSFHERLSFDCRQGIRLSSQLYLSIFFSANIHPINFLCLLYIVMMYVYNVVMLEM